VSTVERVAKAIHAEYRKTNPDIHRGGWDDIDPMARDNWMAEARAAIAALTGGAPAGGLRAALEQLAQRWDDNGDGSEDDEGNVIYRDDTSGLWVDCATELRTVLAENPEPAVIGHVLIPNDARSASGLTFATMVHGSAERAEVERTRWHVEDTHRVLPIIDTEPTSQPATEPVEYGLQWDDNTPEPLDLSSITSDHRESAIGLSKYENGRIRRNWTTSDGTMPISYPTRRVGAGPWERIT
jgi:hypothetical protein